MSLPRRKARQRKPSHFGSYCQPGPIGISSTDFASIGSSGDMSTVANVCIRSGARANKRAAVLNEMKDLTEAICRHKACCVTKWEWVRSLTVFAVRDDNHIDDS